MNAWMNGPILISHPVYSLNCSCPHAVYSISRGGLPVYLLHPSRPRSGKAIYELLKNRSLSSEGWAYHGTNIFSCKVWNPLLSFQGPSSPTLIMLLQENSLLIFPYMTGNFFNSVLGYVPPVYSYHTYRQSWSKLLTHTGILINWHSFKKNSLCLIQCMTNNGLICICSVNTCMGGWLCVGLKNALPTKMSMF